VSQLLPAPAIADRIVLRNGTALEGRVISRDEKLVTVESNGMRLSLDASLIASVEAQSPWETILQDAEGAFRRRNLTRGLELVLKARDEGAPIDRLREMLNKQEGNFRGATYTSEPRARAELVSALRRLTDGDLSTSRTLYIASQSFFQSDEPELALDTLQRIDEEDIRRDSSIRTYALSLLRMQVKRLLNNGDFEKAITVVEDMKRLSGTAGVNSHLLIATLAQSAAARDRGDFATALEILVQDLYEAAPEITRNRVGYTLALLVESASENQSWEEARTALAPIRARFPLDYFSTLNRLALIEAEAAYKAGDLTGALAITESVEEDRRSTELAALHHRAHHEAEVLRIGDQDPVALLQHARWAAANGLLDEAILLFEKLRTNPNLKTLADEYATLARAERDTKRLEEANLAFREGRLDRAEALARLVHDQSSRTSTLVKEAAALLELINKSHARAQERKPYDAEITFQRAERAYFTQSLDESFHLLQLVIRDFPETPAARRASALLPDVVRGLELAFLEGRRTALPAMDRLTPEQLQQSDRLAEEVRKLVEAEGS
jgi:hypothetical protein